MAPSKKKRAANAKSKSKAVPPSIPVNTSQPLILPITAGTEVWNIAEIRAQILSHVDDLKDLASLLRTRKDGMGLVVGKLYYQMDYKHVRSKVSASKPRRDLYLSAITVIDARGMYPTPKMITQLHLDDNSFIVPEANAKDEREAAKYQAEIARERVLPWLESYHPELLDLLLPCLRKRCPGLETIILGADYQPFGTPHWTVELNGSKHWPSAAAQIEANGETDGDGTGGPNGIVPSNASIAQIEHIQTITLVLKGPPAVNSDITKFFPKSTDKYAIRHCRFDLCITSGIYPRLTAVTTRQRILALTECTILGDLYRAIDFDDLPITFDLVRLIVKRQIAAGHSQLLEHVVASHVIIDNPTSFASLASTGLTTLIIAPSSDAFAWLDSPVSQIAPAEIPGLAIAIRQNLPSLQHFEFVLSNMNGAERICRDLLTANTLQAGGSVTKLRVHSYKVASTPFNLVRCLSALVTKDASIGLVDPFDNLRCQSALHRYLQSQTEERQRYLSTVQFPVLGINTIDAVYTLSYSADHSPRHVLSTHLDSLSIPAVLNTTSPQSALQSAMSRLSDATRLLVTHRMVTSAANAPDSPPSAKNKTVYNAYKQVKRQAGAISDIGREMAGSEEVKAMILKAAGIAEKLRKEVKAMWVEETGDA